MIPGKKRTKYIKRSVKVTGQEQTIEIRGHENTSVAFVHVGDTALCLFQHELTDLIKALKACVVK